MAAASKKAVNDRSSTMSIGAVIDLLRPEFPDVTISKVRFLENEGLVTPERTPSGYRRFTSADCDRLRYILTAQRDRYLPLKVIKSELEQLDAGLADGSTTALPVARFEARESVPGTEPGDFRAADARRLSLEMLSERAGVSEAFVKELIAAGLIESGAGGYFDPDYVTVAKTAHALADHGVDIRHLRGIRSAAKRQSDLISSIAAPVASRKDVDAKDRAAELTREIAALSVSLHSALVTLNVRSDLNR